MVSLVKGLAASLHAVVHSVPYQYQLDIDAIKLYLLTYDGIVERNRVSSLQSHEKAHYYYYYYYYLKPR